ncbi:MAG TPA: hypothetical protein VMM92_07105, partial [Thermoanaerobaculia bacterium]|nr:hypothetical protein [Thermoanaerobaculia bacterium]
VGDPRTMPFSFQYELDVQYAVGRIHFEKPEDYGFYAQSVVDAETSASRRRPPAVTLFGTRNPDDRATLRTSSQLVEPLAKALQEGSICKWPVRQLVAEQADKAQLSRLLGGPETPALLFTATHGMAYPDRPPEEMLRAQGALLCQNWPGPKNWEEDKPIPPDFFFAAADVPPDADLRGLIAVHFACYSAGTPDLSDFEAPILGKRQPIADYPFLSRLAQRLLSHPRGGALAVLGHIDRAWTTSFSSSSEPGEPAQDGQIEVFQSTLEKMLDGFPVGCASEYLNQKHAELAVSIDSLFAGREYLEGGSAEEFEGRWRAANDMRNFVVLGDPAVRLEGLAAAE